jgi:hypothetical protein
MIPWFERSSFLGWKREFLGHYNRGNLRLLEDLRLFEAGEVAPRRERRTDRGRGRWSRANVFHIECQYAMINMSHGPLHVLMLDLFGTVSRHKSVASFPRTTCCSCVVIFPVQISGVHVRSSTGFFARGNNPCPDTEMWIVTPDSEPGGGPSLVVVHLDSIFRWAHLIGMTSKDLIPSIFPIHYY